MNEKKELNCFVLLVLTQYILNIYACNKVDVYLTLNKKINPNVLVHWYIKFVVHKKGLKEPIFFVNCATL